MGFGAHLKELRSRVTISLLVIAACSIGGFFAGEWVLSLLGRPLRVLEAEGHDVSLNWTLVTQAFNLQMVIGLLVGFVVSTPVWLYHSLAFFLPGLKKRERRYVLGFIIASIPLFFAGCATGWMILPRLITIFLGFATPDTTMLLTATEYFSFSLKLVVAVGASFVMPVILVMLNLAGMMTARDILGGWRWAVIGITVFAALMTPAGEVISMFILAIPILILYFAAALIAWINDRRRARQLAKDEALA